jgi:tripartite-type tricarboxylate transporter receptor subunit TctC
MKVRDSMVAIEKRPSCSHGHLQRLPETPMPRRSLIAVTAKTRLGSAPDIPTVDEAGLSGFYVSVWNAMWVPKGTPKAIIAKLNSAAREAMDDPAVRKRLDDMGLEIPTPDQQTPEALGAFHKAEVGKWWPIIKAANIKAE